MARFLSFPGGQPLSGTTQTVDGASLTVLVTEPKDPSGNDVLVTNSSDDLVFFDRGMQGSNALWEIRVKQDVLATKVETQDTIVATSDLGRPPADQFRLVFSLQNEGGRSCRRA